MLAFAEKKKKKKKKKKKNMPREHTYYWCSGHSTVIILALRFPVKLCIFILKEYTHKDSHSFQEIMVTETNILLPFLFYENRPSVFEDVVIFYI